MGHLRALFQLSPLSPNLTKVNLTKPLCLVLYAPLPLCLQRALGTSIEDAPFYRSLDKLSVGIMSVDTLSGGKLAGVAKESHLNLTRNY